MIQDTLLWLRPPLGNWNCVKSIWGDALFYSLQVHEARIFRHRVILIDIWSGLGRVRIYRSFFADEGFSLFRWWILFDDNVFITPIITVCSVTESKWQVALYPLPFRIFASSCLVSLQSVFNFILLGGASLSSLWGVLSHSDVPNSNGRKIVAWGWRTSSIHHGWASYWGFLNWWVALNCRHTLKILYSLSTFKTTQGATSAVPFVWLVFTIIKALFQLDVGDENSWFFF